MIKNTLKKTDSPVPTYIIEGIKVNGNYAKGYFDVPIATVESPVAITTNRGKKAINLAGGVNVNIKRDIMTRAPLISMKNKLDAVLLKNYIDLNQDLFKKIADSSTKYGRLCSIETKVFNEDIYMRIGMDCGDAAGHNMTTKAVSTIVNYLKKESDFKDKINFCALSSNYCTDKKPSRINLEKGRGKRVVAKLNFNKDIVNEVLKTDIEKLIALNHKKNETGSLLAGSLGGHNSHYANMIAGLFIATGQDVANVVEGSMGRTSAILRSKDSLDFIVDIPCMIVGTIGGGTRYSYAKKNLEMMDCYGAGNPVGSNSKKLAEIFGAIVLAGELSTMAALTTEEKFIDAHLKYERGM